jgi:hypothetical protein
MGGEEGFFLWVGCHQMPRESRTCAAPLTRVSGVA